MNNIGALIKEYRKRQGLSQLDLSLAVGWENPSTLSRIESGEVKPTRDTIIKLSGALSIDVNNLNKILKEGNYPEFELSITEEYRNQIIKDIKDEWNSSYYPMILFHQTSAEMIFWNEATVKFFIGKGRLANKLMDIIKNKTHIELVFEHKYGIRKSIINWNEIAKILVRDAYVWNYQKGNDKGFQNSLEKWRKIKEFNDLWIIVEKENYTNEMLFNIPLIYKHPKIGKLNMSLSTFLFYQDKRFFVEQFMPDNLEDAEKLKNYCFSK